MRTHWKMLGGVIFCVMLVTGLLAPLRADRMAISATVAPDEPGEVQSMDGARRLAVLRLDPSTSTFRIPPPASYTQRSPLKVQTATINITYLPSGATDAFGLGLTCQTWPAEAIAAFEYAADIWETLITSTVPIVISACWADLGSPDILGIGGADGQYENFPGAPLANTRYPTALANALSGSRMSGSTVDIHVAYGSTFPWYYGTDGITPGDKVDFASVVLHEICHGLGFAGSMTVDNGLGYWGWNYYLNPAAYDRFTENGAGTALLSYPNASSALATQLVSGDLYFDGPNADAANGGARVKLFSPATWMQGSSYSHLDEIFNGTANDLMTYAIPNGQSMHAPGPIALGILQDIGWPFPADNAAPVLSGLPDQALAPGEASDNAIDLWAFATDDVDTDADLVFTITNSLPLTVGVTIDSDRYIDITPAASFTGTFPVVVEVMDTGGLTDTDSFAITFAEIENTAPTLSGLPDQDLGPGEANDNAIDLWAYATDDLDLDADLSFTITNSPPVSAGVSIDGDRYIDINPAAGFVGTVPVDVQVMDTGGLTDTDTFTINFLETQYIYLPLVMRCYPLVPSLLPISNPDGDGLYTVQWTMPACSTVVPSQYEFQVATDPGFSFVDGDTTAATSVDVYTPDPATYYWRVRAYINGQWTDWSNVRSVNVGAFSYVFVENGTGGSLMLEMVGVETASFPVGFDDYWRSVPVGTYTVRAWARCGYAQNTYYFPQSEIELSYSCAYQALSTLPELSAAEMPGVNFVFRGSVSETLVP